MDTIVEGLGASGNTTNLGALKLFMKFGHDNFKRVVKQGTIKHH